MSEKPDINTADWYVRQGGRSKKIGPFSLATLARMWNQGNIVHRDLLFAEGVLPEWVRAGRLQYLFVEEQEVQEEAAEQDSNSPEAISPPPAPSTPLQRPTQDKDVDGVYYILEGEQLRGPISRKQLEILWDWGELQPQTPICDETGKPVATIEKILQHSKAPKNIEQLDSKSANQQNRPDQKKRTSSGKGKLSPRKKQAKPADSRAESKPRKPAKPTSRKESRSQRNFSELLSDAIAYEKNADAVQKQSSKSGPVRPPARKVRKKAEKRKASKTDHVEEQSEHNSQSDSRKPMRRLQRSTAYSQVCTIWSVIYLVNSVIVLTAVNAIFCLFLKRMGTLCLSTYIPFGATPEELKQEALLIAGFSTVLTGAFLLYHLWYLLRSDCIPWHALVTLGFGLVLGFGMPPEMFDKMFQFVRFSVAVCGLALILTGLGLMGSMKGQLLVGGFAASCCCTLIGVCGLFGSLAQPLFEIKINQLPPALSGTAPSSIVFVVSVSLITLSFPGFCYFVMSKEASRPVKEFWDGHILCAVISCFVIAATSYWMIHPEQDEFISIPISLLPMAAMSVLVAFIPPVLWLSTPFNVGIK